MSVGIMTLAWKVDVPAPDKLVLLALADCANDEGKCWPGLASLCRKTGKCKRSLQESMRALDAAGHITRTENPGKGMFYVVHPVAKSAPVEEPATGSKICTGGKKTYRPVAKSAPKPSRTINGSEGKPSSPRRAAYPPPPGVPGQVWKDYRSVRDRKKAPMSDTAYRRQLAKLTELAEAGYPPGEVVAQSVERGWTGFFPLKAEFNERSFEQLFAERFGSDDAGDHAPADRPYLDEPARQAAVGGGRC